MRHYLRIAALLLTIASVHTSRPAYAEVVLDQQNDATGSAYNDSTSSGAVESAQTFTVGVAGTLNRIEVQLSRPSFTTGDVILTLYNTSGSNPNASLGSVSLPASSIPTMGFAFSSFDVSSLAKSVSVNEFLAFTIKSDSLFFWRAVAEHGAYSGGESKWRSLGPPPGSWQNYNFVHDNGFKTYVDATAPVATPGDFNNDGKVDAADYIVWRKNLNDPSEAALNGNGDGANGIDEGDYNLWRENFAEPASGQAGQVPEPGTLFLCSVAVLGGMLSAWRGHARLS